jgi:hypothetical protein
MDAAATQVRKRLRTRGVCCAVLRSALRSVVHSTLAVESSQHSRRESAEDAAPAQRIRGLGHRHGGCSSVACVMSRSDTMQKPIAFPTVLGFTCLALISAAAPAQAQETPALVAGAGSLNDLTISAPQAFRSSDLGMPGIRFGERVDQRLQRPALDPGRVTGELLGGTAFGSVFALAGLAAGATAGEIHWRTSCDGCAPSDGQSSSNPALIGAALAYPLGTGLGVAWIGNTRDQRGSLAAAIGGSYLGALAGAMVGQAAGDHSLIGFLAGAPIGATLLFNSTRKYERPRGTGLVNMTGKRARLSIPAVSVAPDPLHAQRTITNVRVMDGRF